MYIWNADIGMHMLCPRHSLLGVSVMYWKFHNICHIHWLCVPSRKLEDFSHHQVIEPNPNSSKMKWGVHWYPSSFRLSWELIYNYHCCLVQCFPWRLNKIKHLCRWFNVSHEGLIKLNIGPLVQCFPWRLNKLNICAVSSMFAMKAW
jgi:hypothetical protein